MSMLDALDDWQTNEAWVTAPWEIVWRYRWLAFGVGYFVAVVGADERSKLEICGR